MINRIRAIRKQRGLTLAELASACDPPTTAQTIGRLETGTRNLSLKWMERIARALGVEPEALLRDDKTPPPMVVARLRLGGAEALESPREALWPTDLVDGAELLVVEVQESVGEFRAGDLVYLSQIRPEEAHQAINRDVLVPRPGGRFAFGRLIDRQGQLVGILPPGIGQKQLVVDSPAWIALAQMLVRRL